MELVAVAAKDFRFANHHGFPDRPRRFAARPPGVDAIDGVGAIPALQTKVDKAEPMGKRLLDCGPGIATHRSRPVAGQQRADPALPRIEIIPAVGPDRDGETIEHHRLRRICRVAEEFIPRLPSTCTVALPVQGKRLWPVGEILHRNDWKDQGVLCYRHVHIGRKQGHIDRLTLALFA